MRYFVRTPWWLKKIYPSYIWHIKTSEKIIYLTFDDGPHTEATPFVLDELKKYQAKASFFCVGKNVKDHPELYQRILQDGHITGNHTHNHMNGWNTGDEEYLRNVAEASKFIDSPLFRPPYGRIKAFQAKHLKAAMQRDDVKLIMWDVLSGDFDVTINGERCLENVVLNSSKGSIVVFHDSEKALPLLKYALPRTLDFFTNKGYRFERLPVEIVGK